jgi:hypothetical protein
MRNPLILSTLGWLLSKRQEMTSVGKGEEEKEL